MAVKFQYNKTSLQEMNKQLRIRLRALPTLKNKESALRAEVKRAKDYATSLDEKLSAAMAEYNEMVRLWNEFNPGLVVIHDVDLGIKKIAGVRIPILQQIHFEIKPFSLFNQPVWYMDGILILEKLASIAIEREFYYAKMKLLDHARKKTTQKVNLYEKVQIPGYEEAVIKIKRFLEDEENLSKSSQKILKNRFDQKEVAV
ncbi:MAG TPA: V-type ATP synthase subunit D [Bacteroidales bacterium]|jgi:V/A-type H+-transporting ATPase subunit D|nr:V-type ATP synthase subunit D [Bacteroidales bacterium]MDI9573799.1 V-type ATP synthase subunit D [Bacteroidota bacterium]OQC61305.1 MAG: V-type ATP synthase subunit D [Bacteroidetes bacterium ADurb.Bin012]MBP9511090.1 V-type ATP synthase subunit D [Bacteroidales bacterium]MBP9588041.1 V-type ATP synthase subunit D [Bacteroidales bacterium]